MIHAIKCKWKKIKRIIPKLYKSIISSIAFLPTIISFGFFLLAILVTSDLGENFSKKFVEIAPNFSIRDMDVAKTILTTLIGGILSLTVFSFSMVMVVLNRASSNFSPRLLPGLISDIKNQFILGTYTGTLLFCMMVLINIGTFDGEIASVGLSSMLAAIFGVLCVGFFVYFIHSISNAIQIDTIIERIYSKGDLLLDKKIKNQQQIITTVQSEKVYTSKKTGYFRGINGDINTVINIEDEFTIELIPYYNQYVWKDTPLFKTSKSVDDDIIDEIYESMNFSKSRHDSNDYMSEMIKLMEITVKAMSPGINDPGTAIDALVKLGDLINKSLSIYEKTANSINDKGRNISVINTNIQADELMRKLIQPIRNYSFEDATVMYTLRRCLENLKAAHLYSKEITASVDIELESLKEAISNCKYTTNDRKVLLNKP